jgi:peptidyl-prolyl cis-trans isomerase A (cyclophilin A)
MRKLSAISKLALVGSLNLVVLAACRSAAPEPQPEQTKAEAEPTPTPAATPAATAPKLEPAASAANAYGSASAAPATSAPSGGSAATSPARPVAQVPVSPDDPLGGKFTLEDAVKGLPGSGTLIAEISTELGKLECELYEDRAPITVANFVGLARGLRPFKAPDGKWVKKNAYDGTTFHRVIKGFMIQGGDPEGTGRGEPGYVIPDEIWEGARHDQRGQLCMANRGKNTNGMQFFIMDGKAAHLDGGYTIFGMCSPEEVIDKLASVEVRGDKSVKPTKINKVTIKRKPKAGDKPSAEGTKSLSARPGGSAAALKPALTAAPNTATTPPAPAASQ